MVRYVIRVGMYMVLKLYKWVLDCTYTINRPPEDLWSLLGLTSELGKLLKIPYRLNMKEKRPWYLQCQVNHQKEQPTDIFLLSFFGERNTSLKLIEPPSYKKLIFCVIIRHHYNVLDMTTSENWRFTLDMWQTTWLLSAQCQFMKNEDIYRFLYSFASVLWDEHRIISAPSLRNNTSYLGSREKCLRFSLCHENYAVQLGRFKSV